MPSSNTGNPARPNDPNFLFEVARVRMIERLRQQGIQNKFVLSAMQALPRHQFVDEAVAAHAYEDLSLPIGFSQTISQPYIVAKMTALLMNDQEKLERVLEIGTGCGYQTMVLSHMARQVYTIERINGLLDKARVRFRQLGAENVRAKFDDGHLGWETYAPFDGIIITAAASAIPERLALQLVMGGVMVFPLQHKQRQVLIRAERTDGGITLQEIEDVQFVPLLAGRE